MLIIEQIYVRRSFFGGGGTLEREREREREKNKKRKKDDNILTRAVRCNEVK